MSIAIPESCNLDAWPSAPDGFSPLTRHPISVLAKKLKVLQVGADAAAVALALVVGWLLRGLPGGAVAVSQRTLLFALGSLPFWVITFGHYRLYSARHVASRIEESSRLLRAIVASAACMALLSYVFGFEAPRSLVLLSAFVAFPVCMAEREAIRRMFRRLRSSGRLKRRVVMIGANDEALDLVQMFERMPHLGYEVVGYCADEVLPASDLAWLGHLTSAAEAVNATGAGTAVIAITSLSTAEANAVVRRLHDAGIHVELSAGLCDIPAERLHMRDLGRHAVTYLAPTVLDGWRAAAKRTFDITISSVGLVFAAPVLAVSALLIKLTSAGPAFFHQERVGIGGKLFRIHKLRTMVTDADAMMAELIEQNEADGPLFKLRLDPRVTRVGRVLRKLSIDELPQLWNVLLGEMSLVGPRPALARELPGWTTELRNRLRVKPGLTGMWQVSGRSMGSFADYVRHDLFYVDNWTLLRDIEILAKTVPAVLKRHGAC